MDESNPSTPPSQVSTATYDPDRVITPQQLEGLNLLVHPVWIFDFVELRMRWANHSGVEIWNAKNLEELQARSLKDISGPSSKRMEEFMFKCELGMRITEQWTVYPKGQPKTVQLHVSGVRLFEDDDHISLLCEGIPLLKEELVSDSLRSIEMLRHLPMAVCQFDNEGQVMFQNPAARLWRYNNRDEESKACDDNSTRIPPSSEFDDHSCSSTETAQSSTIVEAQKRAGALLNRFVDAEVGKQVLESLQRTKKCDIEAMIHTLEGPTWSAIRARSVNDPITGESVILYSSMDKSDAIEAKKERKAREQKSEFLAIMAHEIRTPLHQVTGFIDLLDQTELNKEQRSFIKLLKSSARGLMTVISDVLDYSKLEAGKMKLECIPYEPLSVVEGSMEVVRASCEEKNITLSLEWNKDIPFRLMGDPNRLRQVLLNLLSNAVKFTTKGGIHVQAVPIHNRPRNRSPRRGKSNEESGNKEKSMVKFIVSDSGMGVSPEHKEIIFQKYQQADASVARNFGGTGLGLSICQLLIHNMGGSIGVESERGKGASFWFCLPVELPIEKEVTESNEDDCKLDLGSLDVLIVEDNKVNQKLMANMLRRLGHTSELAINGKIAIDMIKRNKYDLVLMDIQMPVMDGLEATRRLRTLGYTDLPIFGLTASVARTDFTELGFNDWLPKPIPMRDLKAKLNRCKQSQLLIQQEQ